MVRYYPKAEYWENLLDIYRRKDSSDRVTLGFYRLMNDVGVLKDKGDYMEMAQLAIDAGVPGEAQPIVEKGMQSGTLKSDDKTEQGRYDRLLAGAKKQADADKASLAQLAKEAEKATQGQADVGLGQAYLSYGKYDEAIAALRAGHQEGRRDGHRRSADQPRHRLPEEGPEGPGPAGVQGREGRVEVERSGRAVGRSAPSQA